MTEAEARSLRGKMEVMLPQVWVHSYRIQRSGDWQIEVRDFSADGMPFVVIHSRDEAVHRWPMLNEPIEVHRTQE